MINENTVFIIGAGAGIPYGYPTGNQLRYQICKEFPHYYKEFYDEQNSNQSYIQGKILKAVQFANTYYKSTGTSIDLFLNRNLSFIDIGKLAITLCLFKNELKDKYLENLSMHHQLISRTPVGDVITENKQLVLINENEHRNKIIEEDWFEYLFQRMTHTLKDTHSSFDFKKNKVSFITFNYDRSLEHYLYTSYINSFEAAKNHFNKDDIPFQIIHVYGKLAALPWQDDTGIEYNYIIHDLNEAVSLSNNIKLINERFNNPEIEGAKKIIANAKKIFFLGFAYADENLEILNIPDVFNKEQEIRGTAIGLTVRERDERFEILTSGKVKNVILEKDKNSLQLLKEYL